MAIIAGHINSERHTSGNYESLPLEDALYGFEKNMIIQAMKEAKGIKNRAAKILGVNTSTLYYKLKKFGLV
jgi:transcriptional regulator with PAS, ATPase and Fis domain